MDFGLGFPGLAVVTTSEFLPRDVGLFVFGMLSCLIPATFHVDLHKQANGCRSQLPTDCQSGREWKSVSAFYLKSLLPHRCLPP